MRLFPDYGLKWVSGPSAEPVTLAEVKAQCRIDLADEDTHLTRLITAVRQACENHISRVIGTQTWQMVLPAFPTAHLGHIFFPCPPLHSVISLTYLDEDGVTNTLFDSAASPAVTSDIYGVQTVAEPGFLYLKPSESWPADVLMPGYPITIKFTAGTNVTQVLEDVKQAILLEVDHLFHHRSAVVLGSAAQMNALAAGEIPLAFGWILDKHRFLLE